MFARVRVTFGKTRSVLEIQRKAVFQDGQTHETCVLVVNEQKQVERRVVRFDTLEVPKSSNKVVFLKVPAPEDETWFIKEGLGPEDWVIVSDTSGLQLGDEVEVKRAKEVPKK